MPETPHDARHEPFLIALVEDEEHLAQGLVFNLQAEGYRVHHEADGDAALTWLLANHTETAAILLDGMLPGRDGFSIVRALREGGIFTPTLMLTARGRPEDIVEGFDAGADDYLPKPFALNVLFARLAALLRRMRWQRDTPEPAGRAVEPDFQFNDRTISFADLEIRSTDPEGEPARTISLTLMEADLLRYLIERPNKVIPRKEILENVWKVHEDTDTRAIDNFIVRLRRYLEPNPTEPVHFLSVRGVGYRFVPPAP
jgi:DNA-binding response OmpR family regulator